MGYSLNYICKKCGKEYDIMIGFGFMFPTVYKEILKNIKSGIYGDEWRKLYNNYKPYVAIDIELCLYKCDSCNHWENAIPLDMYIPNDLKSINNTKKYVFKNDLEKDYHLLKRYTHKCPKCEKEMKKVFDDNDEFYTLSCPKCKTLNEPNSHSFWD